jgi:hypothetical protein
MRPTLHDSSDANRRDAAALTVESVSATPVLCDYIVVGAADWCLYQRVADLHTLGPRILYELLAELGAARLCRTEIDRIVDRYVAAFSAREPRR